jgi:hypothetical protein
MNMMFPSTLLQLEWELSLHFSDRKHSTLTSFPNVNGTATGAAQSVNFTGIPVCVTPERLVKTRSFVIDLVYPGWTQPLALHLSNVLPLVSFSTFDFNHEDE